MRKWRLLLLGILLHSSGRLAPAAAAEEPANDVVYTRHSHFRIPFQAGPDRQQLRELRLFVSGDQGRNWQVTAVTRPESTHFQFEAEHDGLYWFTVQTLDLEGRYYPPTLENVRPSLKVFVDTHPPVVILRSLPARQGQVGVSWEITDEALDLTIPGALRLDFRPGGGLAWQPLRVSPTATQLSWNPGTEGGVEVRLRVRDRAENWGEAQLNLDGGGQASGPPADVPSRTASRLPLRPDPNARMVNNKHFSLNYDVKEVGPSKVSTVDIWYTQDGTNWQKYRTQKCSDSPDSHPPYSLEINVQEEGLYGFTLVVRSGVGLSERPPQVGDKPQVWVEVDITRPELQLTGVVVGRGSDKGKLMIHWKARDKNLTAQPITLSYAEQSDGPWTRIAEKLENTGRYVWQLPEHVPYQFLVRADAVDKAGNVGTAVTPDLIKVDLSQPKVQIIGVEPVAKKE